MKTKVLVDVKLQIEVQSFPETETMDYIKKKAKEEALRVATKIIKDSNENVTLHRDVTVYNIITEM